MAATQIFDRLADPLLELQLIVIRSGCELRRMRPLGWGFVFCCCDVTCGRSANGSGVFHGQKLFGGALTLDPWHRPVPAARVKCFRAFTGGEDGLIFLFLLDCAAVFTQRVKRQADDVRVRQAVAETQAADRTLRATRASLLGSIQMKGLASHPAPLCAACSIVRTVAISRDGKYLRKAVLYPTTSP